MQRGSDLSSDATSAHRFSLRRRMNRFAKSRSISNLWSATKHNAYSGRRSAQVRQIIDYFDHTYVINLAERVDRRKRIERELRKFGFELNESDDTQTSFSNKVSLFPGIKFESARSFSSPGFRGSIASHHGILEMAKSKGLSNVLVLEDDVRFKSIKSEIVQEIVAQIPAEWDVIYFGYLRPRLNSIDAGLSLYREGTIGGHFYAVNGTFFDKMCAYMQVCQVRPAGHPEGGAMGRDATYNQWLNLHPSTRVFIASPNLADQWGSRSSISPRLLDKTPLAPLLRLARTAKNIAVDFTREH
jgi:glycosyl transferase family 25